MVQYIDSGNELNFDKEIEWSVDALLKLQRAHHKKKLFEVGDLVFLQVCVFKIPESDEMVNRRIVMKHPIRSKEPEVCLIVCDYIMWDGLKRTSDEMIDLTIEKYGELLEKHKIKGISKIMPFRQLKTEYHTYELRRKLVNQFDIFLCQSHIFKKDNIYNYLGKIFKAKNKFPISVKLPKFKADFDQNANKYIQNAISSTTFYIKPSSDNYSIRIGNTLYKKEHLLENLKIVMNKLVDDKSIIPGGFKNIRSIGIKTERSKIVPIYISMKSKNDVSQPELKVNVRIGEAVEGEISTLLGKKVTVLPTGEVFVKPLKRGSHKFNSDFEDDDDDDDGGDNDEESERREKDSNTGDDELVFQSGDKKKSKRGKRIADSKQEDDSDGDDDDDDDVDEDATESAEQNYLKNLNYSDTSEDEREKEDSPNKSRKRKGKSKPQEAKKPKKGRAKEFTTKKLSKKKGKRQE